MAWEEPGAYDALGGEEGAGSSGRIPDRLANRSLQFNATSFQEDWPGFRPVRLSFYTNGVATSKNLTAIDSSEDYPDDGHQTLRVHVRSSGTDKPPTVEIEAWSYENKTSWQRQEAHPVLVNVMGHVSRTDRGTIDAWLEDVLERANFAEEGFSAQAPAPGWIDVGVAIEEIRRHDEVLKLVDHRIGELRITAVGWEVEFEAPTHGASTRVEGFQVQAKADPTDEIALAGDLGNREEIGEDRWARLFQKALDQLSVPSEAFPPGKVDQRTYCGFA